MGKKIQPLLDKYNSLPVQAKAGFWFLVCTVIQRSITIITTPIFTRLLSESEYGEYGVFISWMGILSCFVTMFIFSGLYPQAIVKYDSRKDEGFRVSEESAKTILLQFVALGYMDIRTNEVYQSGVESFYVLTKEGLDFYVSLKAQKK